MENNQTASNSKVTTLFLDVPPIIINYHSMHFSSYSLAENKPRDLQIAAYRIMVMVLSCHGQYRPTFAADYILLMRNWYHALVWKWQIAYLSFPKILMKNKLGERMIKQLFNSVIAKYCDLSTVHADQLIFA